MTFHCWRCSFLFWATFLFSDHRGLFVLFSLCVAFRWRIFLKSYQKDRDSLFVSVNPCTCSEVRATTHGSKTVSDLSDDESLQTFKLIMTHCCCFPSYRDCAPKQPFKFASDEEVARRLWELSAETVGLDKKLDWKILRLETNSLYLALRFSSSGEKTPEFWCSKCQWNSKQWSVTFIIMLYWFRVRPSVLWISGHLFRNAIQRSDHSEMK